MRWILLLLLAGCADYRPTVATLKCWTDAGPTFSATTRSVWFYNNGAWYETATQQGYRPAIHESCSVTQEPRK
jgi:hypothetical protein